ncbi:chemotaxis protein [Vibrio aestuarianus]|uniref:Chemotaxis protein n=1 Tax=Vibrio aestuarianus TaxID=28171 RepID=A0ABM9FTG5_9VIBR|nr:chemotaxis protein [Vibrio aestuarianus]MDE1210798.1 chemotaxis protein [Vibrio aestuarianus]MDE1215359.1 chemotaxis protein [Vibrio aestuarianus]MDE1217982.1 chemotaxis protein [Vibrio aestuarianus]MDE1257718.1 chemotaxis protein [Vibrio aestuarianus]MDE1262461.1 chemotaxis protein [Vibrio aestuarianus]
MGGKSSSSNQTKTTNVSGQNAISGDNLGTAISGINNSTLNVTATDYGSVNKALDLGGELVEQTGRMFNDALKYAGGVNKDSLDFASEVNQGSLDFAENALEDMSSSNSENLQMLAGLAGNQAAQNTQSLSAMMDLAKFKQDNGVSENKQQQIILMVIIAVVLGAVAIMAMKR